MIVSTKKIEFDMFAHDNPEFECKAKEARDELKCVLNDKFSYFLDEWFYVVRVDGFPCVIYYWEIMPDTDVITTIPFNSERLFPVQELELVYRFRM